MQEQAERRKEDTQMESLVENAVRRAFEDMFEILGADVRTQKGRADFRADLQFAHDARKGTAMVRRSAILAAIGTFVTGAAFGLWSWFTWIVTHAGKVAK